MAKDRIESKYVTVAPGVELHILEKGEGKPLVFIPGLTFSGEIFKNQLEYFSSEYRVIAIDPRGQGYSAKTVDGNDYLTHGRDVAGLIDALSLKDIVLIGWSTGNLDTWSYVQQFGKDKLRGVVTIDMSPLPLSPDPKWWTEGTIEELSQVATQVLTSSQGCREFFSEYATGVMIQHKMEPDELEYLRPHTILDLPSAVLRRCVLQLSGDRKRHRCNSAQPDVHCRTLAGHCKALCRSTASRLRHLRHGWSSDVL